jgi:phosphoribosylformylglycinamidine (FGAM) synthase PurS component
LVSAIKQTSSDLVALKLAALLSSWKDDETDAQELETTVERFIGNTWIDSKTEHEKIYSLWSQFRDDAMHGIGGMTMNERLYCFSLFPRWDRAHTEEERKAIYAKLLANP